MADEIVRRDGEPREIGLLLESRRLIAEAKTLDDVKLIRDKAEAIRMYARQQGESLGIQNAAAEIKLRAERRAGELLREIPRAKREDNLLVGPKSHDVTSDATLSSLGIGRMDSSRWQRVSKLPEETFEGHIAETKAALRELTSSGMLKLAKQMEARADVKPEWPPECGGDVVGDLAVLLAVGRRFSTVYADPPWQYANQGTRASTDNHYRTMSLDRICSEPVGQLVEEDAHLHLWTTNAFLFDAKRVMTAWGFEYKSCFIWVKPQMGIGNYWRVSHEFLLFGIRGRLPFRVRDEMSWASLKRSKHSAKPESVRLKVERVSPGPYLEMYGRQSIPNSAWTVYGNQVSGRLL